MAMATAVEPGRHLSIGERPADADADIDLVESDAPNPVFQKLPDEIIQQILFESDSGGFASLSLLNVRWRNVAQQAHLYAYHLANCSSFSMSHSRLPARLTEKDLPRLRRMFAREVKRNLFEAYLRPNQTMIKLISNSISSTSYPGGEGMQFSPSHLGHHILAYNSSRIYVLDLRERDVVVKRELKILRRPAATCINDGGSMLAVLLTEMQVDIYDLKQSPPKRTQSIILDYSPRAIAISPCGSVLAAAYEGGIEVSSLHPGALLADRRAVRCDAVDALAFSYDGTQILGTTVHSSQPNTVILTAPYYDPGAHMSDENIGALWTTSILFPNTSRDCSHAVLVQNGEDEEVSWTFTYDRSFETFRAVRIDDLRNGTTYFTGPVPSPLSQAKLLPSTLPAASYHGDLVSAAFQGKEVWLYGIPQALDAVPELAEGASTPATSVNRRNSGLSSRSASRTRENGAPARVPQWQLLCDKHRNTFVGGRQVGELEGIAMVKWVANFGGSCVQERLIVAARGVSPSKSMTEDEGVDFMDGGRITLIDFDYAVQNGKVKEMEIEVGTREPEVLEEERRDLDAEVAIVRRRTVAQKRQSRQSVLRAAPPTSRHPSLLNQAVSWLSNDGRRDGEDGLFEPRRFLAVRAPRMAGAVTPAGLSADVEEGEDAETQSLMEAEALDLPYSHASPRSRITLRRAATAAAANRRLQPDTPIAGPVEYRRADGRAEHPHESDADNWVPPPPPYQKEDPGEMPDFMRHSMPAIAAPGTLLLRPQAPQAPIPPTLPLPQSALPVTCQTATAVVGRARGSEVSPGSPLPTRVLATQRRGSVLLSATSLLTQRNTSVSSAGSAVNPYAPPAVTIETQQDQDGDNLYGKAPPDSPRLSHADASTLRRPGARARSASSGSAGADARAAPVAAPKAAHPSVLCSMTLHTHALHPTHRARRTAVAPTPRSMPPPVLGLHMPASRRAADDHSCNPRPVQNGTAVRRLSNGPTWPTLPQAQGSNATLAGYLPTAPVREANHSDTALPPASRPDQTARLGNRPECAAHRLSGGHSLTRFQVSRIPVISRASGETSLQRISRRPLSQQLVSSNSQYFAQPATHARPVTQLFESPRHGPFPQDEETPLIISTPRGVAGAFDPPGSPSSGEQAEPPILAPIPRHPRPISQSDVLSAEHRPAALQLSLPYSNQQVLPSLRAGGVGKRSNRAGRSAAKSSASPHRKKDGKREVDAASSAGWANDVGVGRVIDGGRSGSRGGKRGHRCVMM